MQDLIVAPATPLAPSALAVIRLSGTNAISTADRLFRAKNGKTLSQLPGYTAAYGILRAPDDGEPIDDVMLWVYRRPHSYTGEDLVEITCHGGVLVVRAILSAFLSAGARLADAGEFSKRAFLAGKLDLTQAESIMHLIGAESHDARRSARAQMDGVLARKISSLKEELLHMTAQLAVWADYPEEDLEAVADADLSPAIAALSQQLGDLEDRFSYGKMMREGVDTVLVGSPNVGKSTLMNLLCQSDKSIVTEVAGTTRDVLEEQVVLSGVTLRLSDTAGIHHTSEQVEAAGIVRSRSKMQSAQLLLLVLDGSRPLREEERSLLQEVRTQQVPTIAVIHKADLPQQLDLSEVTAAFPVVVHTAQDDPRVIEILTEAITSQLSLHQLDPAGAILATERQRDCVARSKKSLGEAMEALQAGMTLDAVTICLEEALAPLLELSGERVTDQVVSAVFHNFCVGK